MALTTAATRSARAMGRSGVDRVVRLELRGQRRNLRSVRRLRRPNRQVHLPTTADDSVEMSRLGCCYE